MLQRIVVKIGSSSLTLDKEGINLNKIRYFVRELVELQNLGNQVILVTSGAVAAGYQKIGYKKKPQSVHEKQAAAAVGQALLMQQYQEALARFNRTAGQVLLTRSDFYQRDKVNNALATIEELLHHRILPIVNENDTIATDELKFGDNDALSAHVANLVKAKQLIIITDTDGLYTADPRKNAAAQKIDRVKQIDDEIFRLAGGPGSPYGTGGMRSKIEAARIAVRGGVPVFIGHAEKPGDIEQAVQGKGKGTYFETLLQNLSTKKQWIGFHSQSEGTVHIDSGAEKALLSDGKSLLPAGINRIEGSFHPGDVVQVFNAEGKMIGRGVVNYTAWQLKAVQGLSTNEVKKRVDVVRIEVIHRDEWIPLS